jgi:hypothetical protein
MVASLTGAVSSQIVTEEFKGKLRPENSAVERKGKCLLDCKTDMSNKDYFIMVGPSDPMILCGKVIAQRIKGTPGITG